jgi:hypothetical protein
MKLWQSASTMQWSPGAHGGAPSLPGEVAPPQSTSVSLSFFTPSFELGAWHVHAPPGQLMGPPPCPALALQTPCEQSVPS